MTAFSVQTPYPPFADADGAPLENGYIWLGSAGLDPQSNPVTAYFDAALTIAAAQPIRTQGGYPVYQGTPARIYINGTNYSIRVMNKNGLTVYTALNTTEAWNGSVLADNSVTTAKLAPNAVTAAKVERVAANQVLRSTGVSTDPAWGALDLTTDVTGVLPAANGGTGLSVFPAPGTLGNVLRSDGAGAWTSAALASATETAEGLVELATDAEVETGTDTTRAITPAALRGGMIAYTAAQILSSGTEADFSVPSWAKRITILLTGVSTNGTSNLRVRILDTTGSPVVTTGYAGSAVGLSASAGFSSLQFSAGFDMPDNSSAANSRVAMLTLAKLDDGGYTWVLSGTFGSSDTTRSGVMTGWNTLSAPLAGVRITTVNGTDAFDSLLSKAIVCYE